MRRLTRMRLLTMLAGAVCAGLAATWAVGEVLDQRQVARRDAQEVERMPQKMKTVCVGRFLFDMPNEAVIDLTGARIGGFDISVFDETLDEFQKRVAEREAQIRAKPHQQGGADNLESARDVRTDSGYVGKIFVHSRAVTEGTRGNGLVLERYRYESIAVEALVHADGISIDLSADDYFPERTCAPHSRHGLNGNEHPLDGCRCAAPSLHS